MSEEIKYEMVFGDCELFNGAPSDAIVAVGYAGDKICYFSDQYKSSGVLFSTETSIAMRRIIKTPIWTVADQKAGRMPEVGAKCVGLNSKCLRRVIHVNKHLIVTENLVSSDISEFTHDEFIRVNNPIETPEERAQRLRSEWIKKAYVDYKRLGCELEILQLDQIGNIYDALLSGELQAPTKE